MFGMLVSFKKLKAAGIAGSLLNWSFDYLNNRKQRMTFSGVKSYWNSLKADVPQGSILGLLLFLLYINDIVKDNGSNISLFADDTKKVREKSRECHNHIP